MYKQLRITSEALSRFVGLCTIAFVILLGTIPAVEAAEWRFEPVLRVAGDFDDNPYLSIRTDVAESVSGYILEGSAEVVYASDKTNFDILPTLRRREYGSNSDLNSDDQFLRLNFSHNTLSTLFRIRGDYGRESVRTAERADADLEVEDPDDILDDDTGRVAVRGRRERVRLTPSFLYRMTDKSALNLQVIYQDVIFDDAIDVLLTDYTDTRVNLSYRRAWSPRFTAVVTGTYRNYQTEQGLNEITGAGLAVGIERVLSETSRLRLTVGYENTELDIGTEVLEPVANVSYVRRQKTTTLLAQYRRSISASGSGALGTRDSVNLNFTRQLSDRVSAGIGARFYTTNAIEEALVDLDERTYMQLQAQFTWHLSQTFSLQTDYRYTFLDREFLLESANSNQVTIWLNYVPTPMVRSR